MSFAHTKILVDSSNLSFSREITTSELAACGVNEWSSITAKSAFSCKKLKWNSNH